ncbi:MAG TPA: hypothetical protein ENN69_01095 [Spirochaetia bacterium]|nr:hypothetical protein [Spirochaetia bacterium]
MKMLHVFLLGIAVVMLAAVSCLSGHSGRDGGGGEAAVLVPRYGFFPSPPELTVQSVVDTYQAINAHGNTVLFQYNVPWAAFAGDNGAASAAWENIRHQVRLAHQYGLEIIFVVDPLNGLDRSNFVGLPAGWSPTFSDPRIRRAFSAFARQVMEEIRPRYLGLASEINTYADTRPDDFPYFLSLYREVYRNVKTISPQTQVFVTFQWEGLNRLMPGQSGGTPFRISWDRIEAFEPELDVWAISSYPFIAFRRAADIPDDYYTPLMKRTDKPLAVAEGGYSSLPVGPFRGSVQDQADYLKKIHTQIGGRLSFWIYLLVNDLDMSSWGAHLTQAGQEQDLPTLNLFEYVGLTTTDRRPKPALGVWDSLMGIEEREK